MEIPTPPNLSSEFPENPIVLAKYVGLVKSQDAFSMIQDGNLKLIFLAVDNEEHHVVSFSGCNWVNDLVMYDADKISFKAVNQPG